MDIKEIFKKYEETERIQGDCELTYVPEYNYEALVNEIIKVSRVELPVKPACEYVTNVERAGRDTDYGWFRYQIQKLEEHIRVHGNKIEIRPIDGDIIRMACAFMEYRDGKRDPAGYQIVSKSV